MAPITPGPGEIRRFTRRYSARDILGDSLPDARYFFTVTYRASLAPDPDAESRLVEVTAGAAELAFPSERRPRRGPSSMASLVREARGLGIST